MSHHWQKPTMNSSALGEFWTVVSRRPLIGLAVLSTLVLLAVWTVMSHVKARRYKLPPRIPGVPIFGNTFQLPPLKQGVWAMEMAKQYGEM